jgi:hypothetical protein
MLVRVALERRVAAGRDREIAHDEILGALIAADQHAPRRPRRRAAAGILLQRHCLIVPRRRVGAGDLVVDGAHGESPASIIGAVIPRREVWRGTSPPRHYSRGAQLAASPPPGCHKGDIGEATPGWIIPPGPQVHKAGSSLPVLARKAMVGRRAGAHRAERVVAHGWIGQQRTAVIVSLAHAVELVAQVPGRWAAAGLGEQALREAVHILASVVSGCRMATAPSTSLPI